MNSDYKIHAVIKIGGHALDDPDARIRFAKSLLEAQKRHEKIALVHGGGPQINAMLKRLAIESVFRNGLRVTTPEVLEVAEMVLCGQCNKEITRMLESFGVVCAGISGEDGCTLRATELDEALGRVGSVTEVNPKLALTLIENGFIPVIAPIALDENNQPINVNADTAAACLAVALNAEKLLLISDVPGVLDENGLVLDSLDASAIGDMKAKGVIHGGMIPKVDACLHSIGGGCSIAHIVDGRGDFQLLQILSGQTVYGTAIKSENRNF